MQYPEINHSKQWKYAKPERERRFLLAEKPDGLELCRYKVIEDQYLENTRLRLRKTTMQGEIKYKLTKKVPLQTKEHREEWVSTIYLSESEYLGMSQLPGKSIRKKRFYFSLESGLMLGIDEIELKDQIIWIAELEFETAESMDFQLPFSEFKEITNEPSFSGKALAQRY